MSISKNTKVLLLLSLPMRDTFFLFNFYRFSISSSVDLLFLEIGTYYPILSSPHICIGVPVSLIHLMLNMMNVLKIVVTCLVPHNMLYMLWHLRSLLMTLIISFSVWTFALLINPYNPIFALTLFVGSSTPSSNISQ